MTSLEGNDLQQDSIKGRRTGRLLAPCILFLTSYLAVSLGLWTAYLLREMVLVFHFSEWIRPFPVAAHYFNFSIPSIFLTFFAYERLYTRRTPLWTSIGLLFKCCTYAMIVVMVILFFQHEIGIVSRILFLSSWLFVFIYCVILRFIVKKILLCVGLWQIPVLIVGAGKTAEILARIFEKEPNMGYKIIGLVEDHSTHSFTKHGFPILGKFVDLESIIKKSGIRDVIVAVPGLKREELLDVVYRIQPLVSNVAVVPNLFGLPLGNLRVEAFLQQQTLVLQIKNNLARWYNRYFKFVFDMLATLVGGAVISPVFLAIAVWIRWDSPGPIIFSHNRIGRGGKVFPCYKFRTMVVDAEAELEKFLIKHPDRRKEWEEQQKLKDDPRITRAGRFLRKTSLDELPQLFNVLRGEMSLVGPRPIVQNEIEKYRQYIEDYYLVRPGLTGYWQVSGRSDTSYDERVQMDSWYVRNWSIWLDIVILFRTIKVVLRGRGAY